MGLLFTVCISEFSGQGSGKKWLEIFFLNSVAFALCSTYFRILQLVFIQKKNQEKRAKLYDRHGQRIKMIDELISLSIIDKNESQKKVGASHCNAMQSGI